MTFQKHRFVTWLKKQPKGRAFNMNDGSCCMLSEHLSEVLGEKVRMYGTTRYSVDDRTLDCPSWAVRFQRAAVMNEESRYRMTVKEALTILER